MPDEAAPSLLPMDPIVELKENIAKIKQEVGALQIALKPPEGPWFRTPTLIISLLALLFSFGTTAVSYIRTRQQDIHDRRSELRSLIERLGQFHRESVENSKKYENDPRLRDLVAGDLNSENAVIAKQAAEIIGQIPNNVSATEYHEVAYALTNSNLLDKALKLTEMGLNVVDDGNDEIGMRRFYANTLFNIGDIGRGRAQYKKALEVFLKYPSSDYSFIEYSHFTTEQYWATSEFNRRQCSYADAHVAAANVHVSALGPGTSKDNLKKQLEELQQQVKSCVP